MYYILVITITITAIIQILLAIIVIMITIITIISLVVRTQECLIHKQTITKESLMSLESSRKATVAFNGFSVLFLKPQQGTMKLNICGRA